MSPTNPTTLGPDAALDYAVRGWQVLPVHGISVTGACACNDGDCAKPGKRPHIKSWQLSATADENQIATWWRRWPEANIGIATGRVSQVIVLDIVTRAFQETIAAKKQKGTSMRMAAYGLAVQRVSEATVTRGLYP